MKKNNKEGTIVNINHSKDSKLRKLYILMDDGNVFGGARYIKGEAPIEIDATDMVLRFMWVSHSLRKIPSWAYIAKGDYEWQLVMGRKPEKIGRVKILPNGKCEFDWNNKNDWW